jgi:crotonobetainyl-CoA:carnitine CoA-transferase CaiB-like acyl-CoA transferase
VKLEGLRVVDLSLYLPGPQLTLMLADHGAVVIKVEPPGGDPGRQIGLGEDGVSVFFRNLNRGKRSLCLDLKQAAARTVLQDLVASADVFVEAFRPGVAARLGCDYASLAARNPGLVYVSISAFGQDGPYRDLPAHDMACEAYAGLVSIGENREEGGPMNPPVPAADFAASSAALAGVLMALLRRERTGRGDRLDISMHDCALGLTTNVLGAVFVEKRQPDAREERSWGGNAFYRVYRTKDGRHVVLGGAELKFVRNLLDALGRPELASLCERGPGPHQLPLVEFLVAIFATRARDEWIEWFRGRDVAFAPVLDLREAFDDPHTRARGMRLVDELGLEHLGVPIRFAHEPGRADLRVPTLGEHADTVLRELGRSENDIAALRRGGALG